MIFVRVRAKRIEGFSRAAFAGYAVGPPGDSVSERKD
jgi:hypothetical protein